MKKSWRDRRRRKEKEALLTRDTLCPGLEKLLVDVTFKIFDGNGNRSSRKRYDTSP